MHTFCLCVYQYCLVKNVLCFRVYMAFLFFIQRRTHSQLFLQLIEDIATTMDDVDYPGLGKGFVSQESQPAS